MKRILFAAIAASAMIIACQKTEENFEQSDAHELHASIEADGASKTVLDENNNVRWSEGDQIVAFMKTSLGLKYQLKDSYIGETSGYFSKVSAGASDDLGAGMEWDHIVAYYPYAESIKCARSSDNYAIDVVLPTEQTYKVDSFGNGAWPMVAVSKDNDITFKNVCGGMKLQLKGTQKVVAIKLEGKNKEKLSGAATVTAYTDGETKPAITMASGASTSVTLNCGSGVQLNESTATEFIIALPPVLFSKGFTVTVTDTDSKTYTVETDKANTVLRSSILNMPAFKLGNNPSEEEPGDDELIVPVVTVSLSSTSLKLYDGDTYQLTATVKPKDATDKTVVWSSDMPSVATVDQSGHVTSISAGTANISASAGGKVAKCTVTVSSRVVATADYIDEYGVNHGKGTAIGMAIWAPVNCGYHKDDYKYGKLYQWGRRYGQGYDENYASVPTIEEGGISAITGQHKSKSNVFFTSAWEFNNDWLYPQDSKLWNSGTDSNPVKTENDPCPEGWRVPTYAELYELNNNYSSFTTDDNGRSGRWFSGPNSYTASVPQVFFPAAGYRDYNYGRAYDRGYDGGAYWSSRPNGYYGAYILGFYGGLALMSYNYRANGYPVRCVQDNSPSVPEQEVELVCVMMNNENGTKSIGFDNTNLYLTGDDFVDVNGVDYPIEGNGTNTFVVKVPKADSYTVSYPADAVKVNTDGTYSVNIPDEYVGSSFGVFIGKVADESLQCNLVAICGIVRLDVSAYVDWDRMEFESICGSAMWGNAVLLSDYSVHAISEGESIVTVKRSGDDQYMFMPILPASVNGIAVTMYNKAGDILIERRFGKALTFERGMIYAFERL